MAGDPQPAQLEFAAIVGDIAAIPEVLDAQVFSLRCHEDGIGPMRKGEVRNVLRLTTTRGEFNFYLPLAAHDQLAGTILAGKTNAEGLLTAPG